MEPHNKEEIIRNYMNAYNSFNVEEMIRVLHPEIEFINIIGGETNLTLNGIDAFKAQAQDACKLFKTRNQEIVSIFYGDNHVEVDIYYTGVFAIDLANGLKAGDPIEIKGKSVFQFHDGLITKLVDMS